METEEIITTPRKELTNQQKIDEVVTEYTLALVENMNIKKQEIKVKIQVEKSRHRLQRASAELRAIEHEVRV